MAPMGSQAHRAHTWGALWWAPLKYLYMPRVLPTLREPAPSCGVDEGFVGMLVAYRNSGGLAKAQEVANMFKACGRCDITTLARSIALERVVFFEWDEHIWLPLFQFNRVDMSCLAGLDAVLSELHGVHNHWQSARWFSQPNEWLSQSCPADVLGQHSEAVLTAARSRSVRRTTDKVAC